MRYNILTDLKHKLINIKQADERALKLVDVEEKLCCFMHIYEGKGERFEEILKENPDHKNLLFRMMEEFPENFELIDRLVDTTTDFNSCLYTAIYTYPEEPEFIWRLINKTDDFDHSFVNAVENFPHDEEMLMLLFEKDEKIENIHTLGILELCGVSTRLLIHALKKLEYCHSFDTFSMVVRHGDEAIRAYSPRNASRDAIFQSAASLLVDNPIIIELYEKLSSKPGDLYWYNPILIEYVHRDLEEMLGFFTKILALIECVTPGNEEVLARIFDKDTMMVLDDVEWMLPVCSDSQLLTRKIVDHFRDSITIDFKTAFRTGYVDLIERCEQPDERLNPKDASGVFLGMTTEQRRRWVDFDHINDECFICLLEFEDLEEQYWLKCGHRTHSACQKGGEFTCRFH